MYKAFFIIVPNIEQAIIIDGRKFSYQPKNQKDT